ncbi:hypothetical protein MMA231_03620 (plasmid) [Asticcacaulis sp. MM231]|uniref:helix-turn-helix domain-containing protein n=1 Tax=Asticcacaulis sp. MM231 TaxID=3157666 RepID=UPI0032D5A432
MKVLGENLKLRAKELKLTDTAVAERAGLDPRRYSHYATGDRDPDFGTLIGISKALLTTPNALLGVPNAESNPRIKRLVNTCANLGDDHLDTLIAVAESLAVKA